MADKELTELMQVIQTTELSPSEVQIMFDSFTHFFQEAKEWELKARTIIVTEETQVSEMQQAREGRKVLQRIRLDAEAKRKELKEKSLREGKAVDGIANIIKALVVPIEEYLEKQEKFLENRQAERIETMRVNRSALLANYIENPDFYDLKNMSEEGFNTLLENSKIAFMAKKAAERKEEEARIKAEERKREEDKKMRAENEKMKEKLAKEQEKSKKEREAFLKHETEQREKYQKEQAARLRAEQELKEKKEAEVREKQEQEAEKLAKERLEKEKGYRKFLADNGYSNDTKHLFKVEKLSDVVILYKIIGTFKI